MRVEIKTIGEVFSTLAGVVIRDPRLLDDIIEEAIPLPWADPGEGDGAWGWTECYALREEVKTRLQAFWAWGENNRALEGPGITEAAEAVLGLLLDEATPDSHPLLAAGRAWARGAAAGA